jgi:hypothetical protein
MKRPVEKKQRKGRGKINKSKSSIAKAIAGSSKAFIRRLRRGNEVLPNSSKIGAGSVTARRNLPMSKLHKKNHRSNDMIGNPEPSKLQV